MSIGATQDARLDRLQRLAAVVPLAYIPLLIIVVSTFRLPFWAEVLVALGISMPFVFGFTFIIFGVVSNGHEELLQRERRFRGLLESAPDAIVIVDSDGRIVMTNEQASRVFGYTREELAGQPVEMLMREGVRAAHVGHRADYHARPTTRPMSAGLELTGRRKDGTIFPAEISLSPIESEEGLLVTSVIRDITDRRRIEEERERLMAEAEAERERQRIGMDLHDGVIQSIYAVGLNLEAAADDVTERPGEVQKRIDRAIEQLNDTIRDIRSYIFEMRPTRFSGDLGESLTNLAQEFRVNSLIEAEVVLGRDLPPLTGEVSSAVFHITQEALNNVRKHARASYVIVRLDAADGAMRLTVRDNGVGFDASFEHPDGHRGLRNMSSRAQAAGGTLNIESAPQAGTCITVHIPVQVTAGEAR